MNIDKLKGAAEAAGGKLIYNRSLGFYEVVRGTKRIKFIATDVLRHMDVPTFMRTYMGQTKRRDV